MMDITDKHCPDCGYTEEDANIHLDHHLCINKNPPWETKEKADWSALIERIEQIIKGSPITHYTESAEMAVDICIKSDDAREYWTNPIQRDYEWESYIAKGRERFIDQACEAVDAKKKKTIPGRVSISMFDDAYNDGLDAAKQAIRDRFKPSED